MLALLTRVAGWFGISVTPVVFGLGILLGGAAATIPAHWLGERAGRAEANQEAEVAALQAELAASREDLATSRAAAAAAQETARANGRAMLHAEEKASDYAKELASRGEAGACRLNDRDVERMRPYPVSPDPARARPPARP